MPIDFTLPSLDEPATEAVVERYYQPVGAQVTPGQPLVVVVTERFEWEIPAARAGTISAIMAEPGTTVSEGTLLLQLTEQSAADSIALEPRVQQPTAVYRATPLARRMAAEHKLDLAAVAGSGHGGRITRNDVLSCLAGNQPELLGPPATHDRSAAPPSGLLQHQGEEQANLLTRTRLQQSLPTPAAPLGVRSTCISLQGDVPLAITAMEIDLSALHQYIAQHAPRAARRGIQIDTLACVAHRVVDVLGRHRFMNSAWTDEGIVVWSRVQLAVLDMRNAGTAPIMIPDAAELNVQGIARALSQTQSQPTAVNAPTFTVAALAADRWSELVPTATSAAALAVSAAQRRPVVVEQAGAEIILLRPFSILTLTYDARIIDQLQADAFLGELKQRLERFDGMC